MYTRPYNAAHPLICMDETTKQCARGVRMPLSALPGHPARFDAEHEHNGVGGGAEQHCGLPLRDLRPAGRGQRGLVQRRQQALKGVQFAHNPPPPAANNRRTHSPDLDGHYCTAPQHFVFLPILVSNQR